MRQRRTTRSSPLQRPPPAASTVTRRSLLSWSWTVPPVVRLLRLFRRRKITTNSTTPQRNSCPRRAFQAIRNLVVLGQTQNKGLNVGNVRKHSIPGKNGLNTRPRLMRSGASTLAVPELIFLSQNLNVTPPGGIKTRS